MSHYQEYLQRQANNTITENNFLKLQLSLYKLKDSLVREGIPTEDADKIVADVLLYPNTLEEHK